VGEGVSGDFNLGWITIVDLSVLRYHYTMLWSQFLQKKLTVAWAKKAKIFAKFFGEKIFKIITSVPDTGRD
jgi:hypothetical protein